jgi:hypothetical protein
MLDAVKQVEDGITEELGKHEGTEHETELPFAKRW